MTILNRIKRSFRARVEALRSTTKVVNNSTGYKILPGTTGRRVNGWYDATVAERQHLAFTSLLDELRSGNPREDFVAAAHAIAATGIANPLVIEVGCGSGYYSETLPLLLKAPIRYLGVDYSHSMASLAHRTYANVSFVTADACRLPFASASCDILLSGTSLMHIPEYESAIAESVRVTRRWCIFHTVPVLTTRPTTFLTKQAYGQEVIEVIFNRFELERIFSSHGLVIQATFDSIAYNLSAILDEETSTLTYLCGKTCDE